MSLSFSVITPSYNQGNFIERTIQSVLDQNVDMEYLILDAASTDGTLEVLKKYSYRIKWVSEPDSGQADAVNKGILATQGDIIAWINSDDVYLEGALQTVKGYFEQNPGVDFVYGDAWYIDADDKKTTPYVTEPWDFERLKEVCFICQPAAFFRRNVVERVGLLRTDLQYCMDYEFWLRFEDHNIQVAYLPVYLASSRLYAENKTLGQKTKVHLEINEMLKRRLGYVPDSWLFSYASHITDTGGYSRKIDERRFLFQIAYQSLRAAWIWNRRISIRMLLLTGKWFAGAFF
jgi:glycosyltransferase involved in cell wall biosynthesis